MLYTDAYQLANGAEKDAVLAENAIAYVCGEVISDLYYPDTFLLEEGYYCAYVDTYGKIKYQFILLRISAKIVDGSYMSAYQLWGKEGYAGEWGYSATMPTLADLGSDDEDTTFAKKVSKVVMVRGISISSEQLKRINNFAAKNMLDEIELIYLYSIDTSRFLSGKEFANSVLG